VYQAAPRESNLLSFQVWFAPIREVKSMALSGEFEIIREIEQTLGKPSKKVLLGIGDDAAVTKSAKGKLVSTIDTLVENVHFDLTYMTPHELGHKALAVNLSDLAAMGSTPLYVLVSLGLRQELSDPFVIEFYEGMKKLARKYKVDVIGGNLVQSPTALLVDVVALGEAPGGYVTRTGAKNGDWIAVTGTLGASAAGLNGLKRLGRGEMHNYESLVQAHLRPEPRVKEGLALRAMGGVTSMIDVSDGLAREIHHLAEGSKTGALIEEAALPVSADAQGLASFMGSNARAWALYGGEDYELLFTVRPNALEKARRTLKKLGTPLTVLGQMQSRAKGIKIKLLNGDTVALASKGWNHFVRRNRRP